MPSIKSRIVEVDGEWDWLETAYQRRWTDGLPVIAPTPEAVERALEYLERDPGEELALIPPAQGILTVEQLVLQSIMAGCKPEHVPVVWAVFQAMVEDGRSEGGTTGTRIGRRFNLNGVQCTTNYCSPLAIVNGPIVEKLGFNTGPELFNYGRPNVAIGRAVRLIMWNVGGGYYGETDMATFGQPGKISFCIAEAESRSPWESLAVERGFASSDSAVTVIAVDSPHDCYVEPAAPHPFRVLDIICDVASHRGTSMWAIGEENPAFFILSPRVARLLADRGLTKYDVKQYIFEHARRRVPDMAHDRLLIWDEQGHVVRRRPTDMQWYQWVDMDDPNATVPIARRPDEVQIVVAGGDESWWCAVCPTWGGHGGWPVSAKITSP